jgi:hypothetical protein
MAEIWETPNGPSGTPTDAKQTRVCQTLTFGPIAAAESSRQQVFFQDASLPDGNWALDGWNLYRTAGSGGDIESIVRFWTRIVGGTLFHTNVGNLDDNNSSIGEYGINKSLDLDDFLTLNISIENDGGTDQFYKLTVWLKPRREN